MKLCALYESVAKAVGDIYILRIVDGIVNQTYNYCLSHVEHDCSTFTIGTLSIPTIDGGMWDVDVLLQIATLDGPFELNVGGTVCPLGYLKIYIDLHFRGQYNNFRDDFLDIILSNQFRRMIITTLDHEIGHLSRGSKYLWDSRMHTRHPSSRVLPDKDTAVYRYYRTPREWDAEVYSIVRYWYRMSPQKRATYKSYEQLIKDFDESIYGALWNNLSWRRRLISRLYREGVVIGQR